MLMITMMAMMVLMAMIVETQKTNSRQDQKPEKATTRVMALSGLGMMQAGLWVTPNVCSNIIRSRIKYISVMKKYNPVMKII